MATAVADLTGRSFRGAAARPGEACGELARDPAELLIGEGWRPRRRYRGSEEGAGGMGDDPRRRVSIANGEGGAEAARRGDG